MFNDHNMQIRVERKSRLEVAGTYTEGAMEEVKETACGCGFLFCGDKKYFKVVVMLLKLKIYYQFLNYAFCFI